MITKNSKLRILLVQIEHPSWRQSRQRSYSWHLGIEEGLSANNVGFFTLTSRWFSHAREICAGKQFDQLWINDIAHLGCEEEITEAGLEWLTSLAPVRVGFTVETTQYTPEEYEIFPTLMEYQRNIVVNLKYVTHVVVADEIDVARFGDERQLPAMWLPIPVPKRFIINDAPPPRMPKALFSGLVYGSRARFLADPTLSKLLYHFVSPENRTLYPTFFNALPMHCYHRRLQRGIAKLRVILHSGRSPEKRIAYPRLIDIETNSRFPVCSVYTSYLRLLRHIRRQLYSMYLDGLQSGCAVVNLPSLFKSYSSRVVEGMAAGRPVISWQIPDRPQVNALFEDGQEILLFSKNDPSHLAAQIQRVLSEPDLSRRIVTNARRKIRQFHTIETRVRQILDWVETGTSPVYY